MQDPSSPIIQYFPEEIKIDMNEKKNAWEGIVLLPFIDEKLLLFAESKVQQHLLDPSELKRNEFGTVRRYYFNKTAHLNVESRLPAFGNIQVQLH